MEIPCCMFVKSHVFIKSDSLVVAVYVYFYRKWTRMNAFQVLGSLFYDKTTYAGSV